MIPAETVATLETPPGPNADAQQELLPRSVASEIMPSWERRHELGIGRAAYRTVGEVFGDTDRVFTAMPKSGGLSAPLLYSVVVGTAGSLIWFGVPLLMIAGLECLRLLAGGGAQIDAGIRQAGAVVGMIVLLTPILFTAGPMLIACLLHAILFVFGRARAGFEETARVVCYVTSSWVALVSVLPLTFHALVLLFVGLLGGLFVLTELFAGTFTLHRFYWKFFDIHTVTFLTVMFGNIIFPFMSSYFYVDMCWRGVRAVHRTS